MIKNAILCVAILLCKTSIAQVYDTTQYYGKMNYVFHYVNKTPITTGLLKDYGIEFLNLDNYNGLTLHDSNFVSLEENRFYNRFANGNQPIAFAGIHYN